MIGLILMGMALMAFARQQWLFYHYHQYQGRRGLTGCEMARQILDLMGFSQMTVHPIPGWDRFRAVPMKQLFLEPAVYHQSTLQAIAESSRQAVLMAKAPEAVLPFDWRLKSRWALRFLILPGWIFLSLGLAQPAWGLFKFTGLVILDAVLLLAVLELAREWEASREAYELLKRTENFEPDELVKLKHLLEAFRFEGLTEIFRVPAEVTRQWIQRK